jgi:hypothetical protein
VDSFPSSRYAPQAAFAVGYIHERQKGDTARAIEAFEELARSYPVSPQAGGALERIDALGATELRLKLASYVDSARAWADSVAALAPPDTAEAASFDSTRQAPEPAGPAALLPEQIPGGALPPALQPADSLAGSGRGAAPDTSGAAGKGRE